LFEELLGLLERLLLTRVVVEKLKTRILVEEVSSERQVELIVSLSKKKIIRILIKEKEKSHRHHQDEDGFNEADRTARIAAGVMKPPQPS